MTALAQPPVRTDATPAVRLSDRDLQRLAALVHRLKGMAGNLCATEFEALAQRYMQDTRGDVGAVPEQIEALAEASERLLAELKAGRPGA